MATSTKTETDPCPAQPAAIFRQIIRQEYEANDLGKLHDIRFEFQTICNRTSENNVFSACSCAFHHEFVDYMDGNRIIDVDIFNQICTAIENGKCAHALSAESNVTRATSVSAYHVAIAVGYTSVLEHVQVKPKHSLSRMYRLNDFHIAMLKGHYGYLDESTNSKETGSTPDSDFSRLFDAFTLVEKDPNSTVLKMGPSMTLLRFFAKAGNMKMFQRLLMHSWLGNRCETECSYFVIEDDYIALEALLTNVSNYSNSSGVKQSLTDIVAQTIVGAAVFKNSDKSLRMLEKFVLETNNFEKSEDWTFLQSFGPFYLDIALKLGHDVCAEILCQHIQKNKDNDFELLSGLYMFSRITSGSSEKVHNLIQYLCSKLVTQGLIDEEGTILRNISGKPIRLDIYGTDCTWMMLNKLCTRYPCAARSIFQSGHNCIRKLTNKALMRALSEDVRYCGVNPIEQYQFFDDLLRFIMVHNPDISQINTQQVLRSAINNDVEKHTVKFGICSQTSNFQRAGMILFTIPLLWECGLVFSMNDLIKDNNFESLPVCVRTFLAHAHSKPRSLKLQCRDRIRRHHVGLLLHEWLKTAVCPEPLKRYILIEDALGMTDKTECLCQALQKFVPIP